MTIKLYKDNHGGVRGGTEWTRDARGKIGWRVYVEVDGYLDQFNYATHSEEEAIDMIQEECGIGSHSYKNQVAHVLDVLRDGMITKDEAIDAIASIKHGTIVTY